MYLDTDYVLATYMEEVWTLAYIGKFFLMHWPMLHHIEMEWKGIACGIIPVDGMYIGDEDEKLD